MRTLAYHEGTPCHHFQLAIQQQQKDLAFFRRIIPAIAYSEGWALYAEQLVWELGFQDDPYDNIGRLQAEFFRGVRLVVDTGIHSNGSVPLDILEDIVLQYITDEKAG